MLARFVGLGYLAYLVVICVAIQPDSAIVASWWTPFAVVAALLPGLALLAASYTPFDRLTTTVLPLWCGVGYLLSVGSWYLAWTGAHTRSDNATWLVAFPGLAALALVLTRWPWSAVLHLACAVPAALVANAAARSAHYHYVAAADIAWGFAFSITFVLAGIMAVKSGDVLDESRQRNQRLAGQVAAQRAREFEREFYDALVHDKVLTLLRDADRTGHDPRIGALARNMLDELANPSTDHRSGEPVGFDYLRNLVSATAGEQAVAVTWDVEPSATCGASTLPRRAAMAMADATGEALRNVIRHAGLGPQPPATVSMTSDPFTVTVADRGRGFDPTTTSYTRIGISSSIVGRMRVVGGSAHIRSAPGEGTTVELWWPA